MIYKSASYIGVSPYKSPSAESSRLGREQNSGAWGLQGHQARTRRREIDQGTQSPRPGRAEKCCERDIAGVIAGSDPHDFIERRELGRIKKVPSITQIDFEDGVKVGRGTAVTRVAGDEACGNVERAAERYRKVREVAAHASAVGKNVSCGSQRRRGADLVSDIVADPLANRLDATVSARKLPEFAASERKKTVGLAIFARPYILQDFARQERQGRPHTTSPQAIEFGYCPSSSLAALRPVKGLAS